MGKPIDRAAWNEEAERQFAEIAAWRAAHPAASLDDIEEAIEARLSSLRARLLTDTVQTSAKTDLGDGEQRERCPTCGTRLQRRGHARREVQTAEGAVIPIERAYGTCPRCRAGVFPPGSRTGTACE